MPSSRLWKLINKRKEKKKQYFPSSNSRRSTWWFYFWGGFQLLWWKTIVFLTLVLTSKNSWTRKRPTSYSVLFQPWQEAEGGTAETDFVEDSPKVFLVYGAICLFPHSICSSLRIAPSPLSLGFNTSSHVLVIPREDVEGSWAPGTLQCCEHRCIPSCLACTCVPVIWTQVLVFALKTFYPASLSSPHPVESSAYWRPFYFFSSGSCGWGERWLCPSSPAKLLKLAERKAEFLNEWFSGIWAYARCQGLQKERNFWS